MSEIYELLVRHGTVILFVVVFIDQIGIPLPSAPWLLAAGALAVAGKMNWLTALVAAASGSVAGRLDLVLSGAPLRQPGVGPPLPHLAGAGLLRSPDAESVHALRNARGCGGEIHSRLEHPGAAVGGQFRRERSAVPFFRWTGFVALCGMLHTGGRSVQPAIGTNHRRARRSWAAAHLVVVAGLVALYIGYKYFQRQRLLRELRMARITVDELHQKQEAGEKPMILDLRSHR